MQGYFPLGLGVICVVAVLQWIQIKIMLRSLVLLTVAATGRPVPPLASDAGWFDRKAHEAVTGALAAMRDKGF